MKNQENKLKKRPKGYIHAGIRAGLGAIPFAGTVAIELFNLVVTPQLERRRDNWIREIDERLNELEKKKNININSLKDNDIFLDSILVPLQFNNETFSLRK